MMSRDTLGRGGTLNRGVSHISQVLGKFGWSIDLRRPLRDDEGLFAWTADVVSPAGAGYHTVITARVSKGIKWSVTEDIHKLAEHYEDVWYFAYFDGSGQVRVFWWQDYYGTDLVFRGRPARTYEFKMEAGEALEAWLANPQLRVRARKLG